MAVTLAAVLIATAQAADACWKEGVTLVCQDGDRKYRVIHETPSPSGEYAIAWIPQDRKVTEDKFDKRNDALNYDDGPVENFLIRLADGKPLRKTRGTHWGDETDYNHTGQITLWSPDSAFMIEINDSKWLTPLADVYRIGKNGEVAGPFQLMPFVRKAALEHFRHAGKKVNASRYSDSVKIDDIGDDGAIKLQIIKQDGDFNFDMRIRAVQRGDTIDGRLISLTPVAD